MGKKPKGRDAPAPGGSDGLNPDERAFIAMLIANGQAAEADEQGDLPSGATHEITGYRPDGFPIVVRRNFSG
jgi:hypothetical protein